VQLPSALIGDIIQVVADDLRLGTDFQHLRWLTNSEKIALSITSLINPKQPTQERTLREVCVGPIVDT
jgi:hypothetical protein